MAGLLVGEEVCQTIISATLSLYTDTVYLKTVTSLRGIVGTKNYYPDKKDFKAIFESRCRFHAKHCETLRREVSFVEYKMKIQ